MTEPLSEEEIEKLKTRLKKIDAILRTQGKAVKEDAYLVRLLATIGARDETINEMRGTIMNLRNQVRTLQADLETARAAYDGLD